MKKRVANDALIDLLEKKIAAAKSGDLVGVAIISIVPNKHAGKLEHDAIGDYSMLSDGIHEMHKYLKTLVVDTDAESRTIERFPGYLFYANGVVVGARGFVLSGHLGNTGYRRVLLQSGGKKLGNFSLHRLICEAFHGPPPSPDHHVAHVDGTKLNNSASNLRWSTRLENEADKIRHGTRARGARNGFTDLTDDIVLRIRSDRERGASFRLLSRTYEISRSTAFNVCTGATWGHVR